MFLQAAENSAAIKLQTYQRPLAVISAYSSPYSNIHDALLTNIGDENAHLGVDLNHHSRVWRYRNEDHRRMQVEDFLTGRQFFLLNETKSPPTFEHR
ncbi:hypothetical protein AVEN_79199-1 [Araneus ventricosus]|uniref:Endonuclease/exonuclease/phosphatase domain-containing protein n=1 Tax=Araneus ventricosus TaxID=182803 RepID=A0A4Y2VN30_ARAVE|nr:hypothetical protein AVEN_79199-1 [Araneus ventricosus]